MNNFLYSRLVFTVVVAGALHAPVGVEAGEVSEHEMSVWRSLIESPLQLGFSIKNARPPSLCLYDQPVEVNVGIKNIAALELMHLPTEKKAELQERGLDVGAVERVSLFAGHNLWTENVRVHIGRDTNSLSVTIPAVLVPIRDGGQPYVDENGMASRGFFTIRPASGLQPGTYVVWASLALKSAASNTERRLCSMPVTLTLKMAETDEESAWVLAEQAREQSKSGNLKEAAALYRRALEKSPNLERGPELGEGHRMFNLHAELADLYERMGKFDDALAETIEYEKHVSSLPEQFRSELMNDVITMRNRLEMRGRMGIPVKD